ncbi:MAG: AAA family ATPase [Synergistaceae bacterium]
MDKNLISRIRSRQRKLQKAKVELKNHFVGIDDIIDKVIKDVETWYVMPELLSRPTIVCLFGPTGVGKTDLVRRLVKLLNVQDRFCELTLSNRGCPSHPWSNSIASILCDSNVKSGQPSVIMMDEIQNFRTIDHEGNDIHDCKFKDVWTLLSDGKLPYMVEVDNLMGMLWDIQQKEDEPNKKRVPKSIDATSDDDDDDDDGPITPHFYQLNHFKSALRLEEPIEEIAKWTDTKRKQVILKRLADKSIFEEEDYTKCLIFISGNLDEAYGFAKDVKEVDVDADILHEMSKKIGILDIKQALTKRFKPEQISRMGNGHIIYPSLSKSSFRTIIERKITAIKDRVYIHFGISVTIDSSINELIYNNGVYPTQGTRPLFSTISDIIESSLPGFLLKAILKDTDKVYIDYKNELIRGKVGNSIVKRKYEGVIDKLKKERRINRDRRTLTAVHEAGHAVGFASLFKFTPSQIVATPASNDTDGFVYTLKSCSSKNMARRSLCVLLAGQVAEKIFFGSDNVTSGSSSDLYKATERAAMMIRKWGMGNYVSTIANQEMDFLNNDQDGSNNMIEALLQECKLEVEEVLNKNIGLMEEVIDTLLVVDKILSADFVSICAKHGLKIGEPLSSEEMIFWKYSDAYNETKNSRKRD